MAQTAQDTLDTAPTSKKPRRGSSKHSPITQDQLRTILADYNAAVAHLRDPEANPKPDLSALVGLTPFGSITEIVHEVRDGGEVTGFRIGNRGVRYVVPSGLRLLLILGMFGGVPFIDTNKKGGQEQHYVEVFGAGFTLQRLMAGAEAGEVVRLIGPDHHLLFPWCLRIESGNPRAKRDRRGAIAEALKRYDAAAAEWGLSDLLTRQGYESLLRGCFRLFDAEHGRHLLRVIPATA